MPRICNIPLWKNLSYLSFASFFNQKNSYFIKLSTSHSDKEALFQTLPIFAPSNTFHIITCTNVVCGLSSSTFLFFLCKMQLGISININYSSIIWCSTLLSMLGSQLLPTFLRVLWRSWNSYIFKHSCRYGNSQNQNESCCGSSLLSCEFCIYWFIARKYLYSTVIDFILLSVRDKEDHQQYMVNTSWWSSLEQRNSYGSFYSCALSEWYTGANKAARYCSWINSSSKVWEQKVSNVSKQLAQLFAC